MQIVHHRNIKVDDISHMGMVHSPVVLRVVASLLAEPHHGTVRTFIDSCLLKVFKPTKVAARG
jgi:hypothetical protein